MCKYLTLSHDCSVVTFLLRLNIYYSNNCCYFKVLFFMQDGVKYTSYYPSMSFAMYPSVKSYQKTHNFLKKVIYDPSAIIISKYVIFKSCIYHIWLFYWFPWDIFIFCRVITFILLCNRFIRVRDWLHSTN